MCKNVKWFKGLNIKGKVLDKFVLVMADHASTKRKYSLVHASHSRKRSSSCSATDKQTLKSPSKPMLVQEVASTTSLVREIAAAKDAKPRFPRCPPFVELVSAVFSCASSHFEFINMVCFIPQLIHI
jgi:hypothetical protein